MGKSSSKPLPSSACPICLEPTSSMGKVTLTRPTFGSPPVGPRQERSSGPRLSPEQFAQMAKRDRPHEIAIVQCCGQTFHFGCLAHWVVGKGYRNCPLCRAEMCAEITFRTNITRREKGDFIERCFILCMMFLSIIGAWSILAYAARAFGCETELIHLNSGIEKQIPQEIEQETYW